MSEGFKAEKAIANRAEMRALKANDISYKEESGEMASRARIEVEGVSTEKKSNNTKVI